MNQEDRDMLREAREFVLMYDENVDEFLYSIEEVHEFAKENGVPDYVQLIMPNGYILGCMSGEDFMKIDVNDLDKDNYIEKSRKVDNIVVTYGDFSSKEYDSVAEAAKGIAETLNGCDFAVGVEKIEGYIGDEHFCNYTAEMVAKLTAQPAV